MTMDQAVEAATERAIASGSLHKITSATQVLLCDDFPYLILNLNRVEKPQGTTGQTKEPKRNPFAAENLEEDLYVQDILGTHNLILNKFNILDRHVVLTTKDFEKQQDPLNPRDFCALWTCVRELHAFGFFNCGYESGASQPHKHMQLIPLQAMLTYFDDPNVNELPWMHHAYSYITANPSTSSIFTVPWFPFKHAFVCHNAEVHGSNIHDAGGELTSRIPSNKVIEHLFQLSCDVLKRLECNSYNLILTSKLLFIVPRRLRSNDGIEINSMGFAGSFLVRDDTQLVRFREHGPFSILSKVCFGDA